MQIKQLLYLPWWFLRSVCLGKKAPLQTVIFITDRCNLRCKHCSVYQTENIHHMSFEDIRKHLQYSYSLGSRFVDIEGGETTLWKEDDKNLNDVIRLAKEIGFFSVTVTTNAQQDFSWVEADSIWVSLDGIGKYHEMIRGEGTFQRLEKNIAATGKKHLDVNMVVNRLNKDSVEETLEYAKQHPAIEMISINFHTPFPGTEYLALDKDTRNRIIDTVIRYKKQGYPVMNSYSGLRKMKQVDQLKNRCWITNFVYADGTRGYCAGMGTEICKQCGFCMSGEMAAVFSLHPDTVFAGMKLRM